MNFKTKEDQNVRLGLFIMQEIERITWTDIGSRLSSAIHKHNLRCRVVTRLNTFLSVGKVVRPMIRSSPLLDETTSEVAKKVS